MRAIASARRAALVQFAVSSAVLLAVVATIGAVLLKRVATGEALQDARAVTVAFSEGVLREHITPGCSTATRGRSASSTAPYASACSAGHRPPEGLVDREAGSSTPTPRR